MNNQNNILYFAYGINMDEKTFKCRCQNYKFIGIGYLPNHRIGFTRKSEIQNGGVADIIPDKSNEVWGVLYNINEESLNKLDKYEGYPYAYLREKKSVYLIGSTNKYDKIEIKKYAWVYVVKNKSNFIAPNAKYLNKIIEAAYEYSFPSDYIIQLKKYSAKTVQEKNLLSEFVDILDAIRKGNINDIINNVEEWGGADVLITSSIKKRNEFKKNYHHITCVFTKYSKELSWLFFKFKVLFEHRINFINKYDFYYALAQSANDYLEKCKENNVIEKRKDLLLEVVHKAYSLYDNFEK